MLSEGQDGSNDLDQFFSFARDVERTILKSGRSEPTANEIQDYSWKYWRAVDHLCDRLQASPINDPLSDRSFRKFLELTVRCEAAWRSRFRPHGYPGDYRTMELFYRLEETPDKESPPKCKTPGETLVESAFARTHGIRLIQKRAKILESFLVERLSAGHQRPLRMLDVGGGGARYFRRAIRKVVDANVSYTIIDQDPSLPHFWCNEIPADVARNVTIVSAPVKSLLSGECAERLPDKFDLVMSSGLFDYLDQGTASQLAAHLFSMLRKPGALVIANMLNSEPGQAAFFRETIMDWHIVKRTDDEMRGLVPSVEPEGYDRFPDVDLGVVYFRSR